MKGISRPCACAWPRRPRPRSARARSANSWQRRLLPTPGSATIPTAAPSPALARSSAASSTAISSVAADEAGEAALAREVESRARRADPGQLEDAHRPARPLDLELAQVLQLEVAVGQLGRGLGQVGLAGLGQRLHPLRQADRVADRRVAAVAASPIVAGDHLARVDPDPGGEVEPVLAAQLGGVLGDVVEHPQRREAGAPGVVLVGDRGAEDGHDPVAGEFVDGALEAVHLVGEDREEALHDLAPLLGVVLLGQVHRALDVGEEHGDLLALAVGLDAIRTAHRTPIVRPARHLYWPHANRLTGQSASD